MFSKLASLTGYSNNKEKSETNAILNSKNNSNTTKKSNSNSKSKDSDILSTLTNINKNIKENKKENIKPDSTPEDQTSSDLSLPELPELPQISSNDNSSLFNFSYKNMFITVLILSLLGFNLFKYFGNIVEKLREIFKPLLSALGYYTGETTKQTINMSSEGSKYGIDKATAVADKTIELSEKGLGVEKVPKKNTQPKNIENKINESEKQKKVIDTINKDVIKKQKPIDKPKPISTENNIKPKKGGYCFMGEENGNRTCIEVKDGNNCLSNALFPTMEVCINPSLRV